MNCPSCGGTSVTVQNKPYISAHMKCLRCGFTWRVRGGRIERVR